MREQLLEKISTLFQLLKQTGLERKVFIKQAQSDDPLTAGVWCGNAYFPDFYKADTNQWWSDMFDHIVSTYDNLEVDGVWLDMNENNHHVV